MPGLGAGLVRAYHFVVPPFSAADPRAPMSRVSTHVGQSSLLPGFDRVLRMACTCGSPGLPAFSNSTVTSCAATAVAPTIHCWYTSATSTTGPSWLVTGLADRLGNPVCEMMVGDPVYLAQFPGLLSSPGWTVGLPLVAVMPWMRGRRHGTDRRAQAAGRCAQLGQ